MVKKGLLVPEANHPRSTTLKMALFWDESGGRVSSEPEKVLPTFSKTLGESTQISMARKTGFFVTWARSARQNRKSVRAYAHGKRAFLTNFVS